MKKLITILMTLIVGVSIYSNSAFGTVIAQVKLEETQLIKLNEMEEKISLIEKQYKRELTSEEKDQLLDSEIDRLLVLQAARRDGMEITEAQIIKNFKAQNPEATDEQIKRGMEQQYGQPWDEISRALRDTYTVQQYIQFMGQEEFKNINVNPTQEEIIKYYTEKKELFKNPDLVRVDHVYFQIKDLSSDEAIAEAKKRAEDALTAFKQGKKTFDELVQEESDDKNSARNGGELGFLVKEDPRHLQLLGANFINQVFELPMDEVHGVLRSNQGFHIILIREKRSERQLKITDPLQPGFPTTVAQSINERLKQEKSNAAIMEVSQKIVDEIRKEAVIKKMDKLIPWK